MLLHEVVEGFVGQFLKGRHAVARQLFELGGRIVIESNQFAHDVLLPAGNLFSGLVVGS